ncbi:MAG TPA: HAD family hydrolase [Opitutaceae bacterium]|nr:HAD family hydrolase [Opitutaceae bacterium]
MSAAAPTCWVAVDSDGCVLDAMTPKHRDAFVPALIEVWRLAPVAAEARALFLELNLHSPLRGVNRFVALGAFWRALPARITPDRWVQAATPLDRYFAWLDSGAPLTEHSLAATLARAPHDAALERALAWSHLVNIRCARLPRSLPFPGAAEAMRSLQGRAAVAVLSSGNGDTIRREWSAAGLTPLVSEFFTQEAGDKPEMLGRLVENTGDAARVLMIGDSPVDEEAARRAGARFFPIIPGAEADSWRALRDVVLDGFLNGAYDADEAAPYLARFHAVLQSPAIAAI